MGSGTPIAQGAPALSPDVNPQSDAPLQNLTLAPPPGQEFNVPDERLVTQTASELGIPDFDRGEFIFNPDLGGSEAQQRELFEFSADTFVPIFRDIAPSPPPQEDDIIFDAFDPPSQPLPLIDFNEAVAQQQIQAGNIAAALQDQTGRSNPILDAILRGRERAQAERQRRTKQTGSPTGGLTQLAFNTNPLTRDTKAVNEIGVRDLVLENARAQVARQKAEAEAKRARNLQTQLQAEEDFFNSPSVPAPSPERGIAQSVIDFFTRDGKGGAKSPSVFERLLNSGTPPPQTPSTIVPIPLSIRDRLLDDAQGRARGGLVGLIRKGN